jgi:hypothetical protein
MLSPLMLTVFTTAALPSVMLKMRDVFPASMMSLPAPGPLMARLSVMTSWPSASAISPSSASPLKTMVSAPGALLASVISLRSVPSAPLSSRLSTMNVAGAIRASSGSGA